MQAQSAVHNFTSLPAMALACAVHGRWLLACLLCVLPLTGGCQTEKQERFQQFSKEGVRLFSAGDYVSAREHFEVALALESKDPNILFNLGQCHDRLNQSEQAQKYYQDCLTTAPNHPECRHALAVLLYRNGRAPEANQMIEGWLTSQPQLGAAYAEDGWRLRHSGDLTQAVGRFQQALHYDSKNVRALIELGQIHEEQEHFDYALALYTRALEINPQQPYLADRINELRSKKIRKPLAD